MKVVLKHPQTGEIKESATGFAWWMLLFGVFVPLVRGDFKWFFLSLLLSIPTFGLIWIILPFIYNKIYIKELIKKGFKVQRVEGGSVEDLKRVLNMDVPIYD